MRLPVLMMALLLTGCATGFRGTEPVVVDTFCVKSKLILVSKNDKLTDGTARQILAHNLLVDQSCPKRNPAEAG